MCAYAPPCALAARIMRASHNAGVAARITLRVISKISKYRNLIARTLRLK